MSFAATRWCLLAGVRFPYASGAEISLTPSSVGNAPASVRGKASTGCLVRPAASPAQFSSWNASQPYNAANSEDFFASVIGRAATGVGTAAGRSWLLAVVVLLAALTLPHAAAAQSISPEQEYSKSIRDAGNIDPSGGTPFGENLSLYTGSLSFEHTDLKLEGTGPTLELVRSFKIKEWSDTAYGDFADWVLSVPRIMTDTAWGGTVRSWQVPGAMPDARCSRFSAPPIVSFGDTARTPWTPHEWWNGYALVIPGHGSQDLLANLDPSWRSQVPGLPVTIGTTSHWVVGCLPNTANGEPGEAFLVVSPAGTRYWMNHLVYKRMSTISKPLRSDPQPYLVKSGAQPPSIVANEDSLDRREASMLVTRIEDRFGNWLAYAYSGAQLTGITASDGRSLAIAYAAGVVQSVTLNSGTAASQSWTYDYTTNNGTTGLQLATVVRPDGSKWQFDLTKFSSINPNRSLIKGDCDAPSPISSVTRVGTITNPSGLRGEFTIDLAKHGRSYVQQECWGGTYLPLKDGYALTPNVWYDFVLKRKAFTGPGLPVPSVWTYQYSPPNQSWTFQCVSTTCASTVWTDTVDPAGHATRNIFSNRNDHTEGLLLRTEDYASGLGSALLRSRSNVYSAPDAGPWPATIGDGLPEGRVNTLQVGSLAPLVSTTTSQDSSTFQSSMNEFDGFGRAVRVTGFSSLGYSRSEKTEFHDDPVKWVIGQVRRQTDIASGVVVSQTDFDANALPWRTYGFGKLQYTFAYYGDGNLSSIRDANGNTTVYSNWWRGLPQRSQYPPTPESPAGAVRTAVVNEAGWIKSSTDENGFTTGYDHDPMGRLRTIVPAEGNPTSIAFQQLDAAEYGIAAGHWRQVQSTGNARKTTYFDAFWRPLVVREEDMADTTTIRVSAMRYDLSGQVSDVYFPQDGAFVRHDQFTQGSHSDYDALGRVIAVTQDSEMGPLVTRTVYLPGFKRRTTNPRGFSVLETFQAFDVPSYDAPTQIDLPENARTTIVRDRYGKPTAVTRGPGG